MTKSVTGVEDDSVWKVIAARVEERLNAHNLSRNEASRRAGLGLGYVTDLLLGKTKSPSRQSMAKLGQVLDTDVAYFFGEQDVPRRAHATSLPSAPVAGKPLPLYHTGLTDPDGFFALDDGRKAAMSSPLNGDDLYCVVVPDDTMAPRYLTGEVVVVNPRRQVSKGGFAVVRHTDGRVAVREVVSIAPDKIVVRSLDPNQTVDMTRDQVKSLDRIIGSCEQQ
jgi:transcriptional regulator with XRE-family HTH domain